MKDLSDLLVFRSEEMIERAYEKAFAEVEAVETGDPTLDESTNRMVRHVFFVGWMACLTAILAAENRKDGIE